MSIRLTINCAKQKGKSTKKHEPSRTKLLRGDSCNFVVSFSRYFPITLLIFAFLHASTTAASAQNTATTPPRSPLDATVWGVIYDTPATKLVTAKRDVTYFTSPAGAQTIDIYTPPGAKASQKLPAVIFLNAIGDRPGDKVKNWEIYSSWPRLSQPMG